MSDPTRHPLLDSHREKRHDNWTLILAPHPGPLTSAETEELVAQIRALAGLPPHGAEPPATPDSEPDGAPGNGADGGPGE